MKAPGNAAETPVVFDCGGESLVGIVHRPEVPMEYGVLTVVAGGPQYRGGVGRGLVTLGRDLSSRGIAVMRFDHRGLGDSSGEFLGFEQLEHDLTAAVKEFKAQVPALKKVVLWGGCDAASGIMIHACKIPEVASIMVGNPFVSSSETKAAVVRQHYLKRLGERSFWLKLLRFEYNISNYIQAAFFDIIAKLRPSDKKEKHKSIDHTSSSAADSFINLMLSGVEQFKGPVLFIMSGQSLVSKEFDELTDRTPAWKAVCNRSGNRRIDLPDADQAFSSQDSKSHVNSAIFDWVATLPQL